MISTTKETVAVDDGIEVPPAVAAAIRMLEESGQELLSTVRDQVISLTNESPAMVEALVTVVKNDTAATVLRHGDFGDDGSGDDDDGVDDLGPTEGWAPVHAVDLLVSLYTTNASTPSQVPIGTVIEAFLDLLEVSTSSDVVYSRIGIGLEELGAAAFEPVLRHVEASGFLEPNAQFEDEQDLFETLKIAEEGIVEDGERDPFEPTFDAVVSFISILARSAAAARAQSDSSRLRDNLDDRIFTLLSAVFDSDLELGAALLASFGDTRALPMIEEAMEDFEAVSSFWEGDFRGLVEAYTQLGGTLDNEEVTARIAALEAERRVFEAVTYAEEEDEAEENALLSSLSSSSSPSMTVAYDRPKPGRNDPCPCGSGKKYKKCCLP